MKKLTPRLEEIVSSIKGLKKDGIVGFFDIGYGSYLGHDIMVLHQGHTFKEIHVVDLKKGGKGEIRRDEYEYFTGYISPQQVIRSKDELCEFMMAVKRSLPRTLTPEVKKPEIIRESYNVHDVRLPGGGGVTNRGSRRILEYGNITYSVSLGEEKEVTATTVNGKERERRTKILVKGQELKLVFYPTKAIAQAAFEGKTEQNVYYFEGTYKNLVNQPKLNFDLPIRITNS